MPRYYPWFLQMKVEDILRAQPMPKYQNLFFVLVVTLILLNFVTFFSFPIEGSLLLALLACLWLLVCVIRRTQFRVSKGFLLFFVFCAYALLMSSFSYPIPANGMMIYIALLFTLLSLLVYSTWSEEGEQTIWQNGLILAALTIALLELAELAVYESPYRSVKPLLQQLQDFQAVYRLSGLLFIHPNVLAGYLNFVWPIMAIRIIQTPRRRDKALWFLGLVLIAVMFLLTISRGGVVGAILGGSFLLFRFVNAEISKKIDNKTIPSRRSSHLVLGGIGFLLTLALILGVIWRATITGQFRFAALESTRLLTIIDALSSGRGFLWKNAWEAFLEKPLLGHGNAGFPIAYVKAANLPPGFLASSAHNLWLNVAVEYGLIGLIGFTVLLIVSLIKMLAYLQQMRKQPLDYGDAYWAGLIAFLGQHLFDSMLWVTNYLAALLLVGILLMRRTPPFGEWQVSRKTFVWLASILLVPLGIVYASLASDIAPSLLYLRKDLTSANPESFQTPICALADRYNRNALYHFQCSQAIASQLVSTSAPRSISENVDLAVHYQEKGFLLNPFWPPQQANLAALYWLQGNRSLALDQMRLAALKAPKNSLIWLNLGWMEEQVGNQQAALEAYTRVLRLSPLVLNSTYQAFSDLFPLTASELASWMTSEAEWDSWYEYEILDKDYQRGIFALALGDSASALLNFESSAERFPTFSAGRYAYDAFAQDLSGVSESAYQIAYELALLDRKDIIKIEDPLLVSYLGKILLKNDQTDLAYHLFRSSYFLQTRITDPMYYSLTYRQPILRSDLSPLLIRNLYILEPTRPAWGWFIEQAYQREPVELADEISFWYAHIDGLASLEGLQR